MLLCPSLGELTVRSWLLLPLLFLGSSAGIAAVLGLLLEPASSSPPLGPQDVALSSPLLFGVAATLAVLSGQHVRWASPRQRRWLRTGYPLLLLVAALSQDDLHLPGYLALTIGAVATALLVAFLARSYRQPAACDSAPAELSPASDRAAGPGREPFRQR